MVWWGGGMGGVGGGGGWWGVWGVCYLHEKYDMVFTWSMIVLLLMDYMNK